jgi:hypothetical protein
VLDQRRSAKILGAERARLKTSYALPLRDTAHPVTYPSLAPLTKPGQVGLNASKRGAIKRGQVLLKESLDFDQIDCRQTE